MAPLQLSYYPGKIAAVLKRGIKLASFRVETFYLFLFAPTSSASSANSSFLDRRSTSGYTDFSFSRSFSAMLPFALFVSIPRLEKKLLREKRADWRYKLLLTLVVYSTNLFFSFLFFFFLFAISASSFSSCTEVLSRYLARLSFDGARYFDEKDIASTRIFNLKITSFRENKQRPGIDYISLYEEEFSLKAALASIVRGTCRYGSS